MSAIFEFHISRRARDRYHFDESLLGTNGRLIVVGRGQAAGRGSGSRPPHRGTGLRQSAGRLIAASEIFAAALIEEILHLLIRSYESQNPGVMANALGLPGIGPGLQAGNNSARSSPKSSRPPRSMPVSRLPRPILSGSSQGIANRQITIEEMLLLKLANSNPALEDYKEFFDDRVLADTAYQQSIAMLEDFFSRQPPLASRGAAARPRPCWTAADGSVEGLAVLA